MKKFKLLFYKFFKIKYCDKCLSPNIEYNFWSRCWDKIYGGCHGDMGHRCFDCGYIVWKTPFEKYEKQHDLNQWKIYKDSPRYKDGELI